MQEEKQMIIFQLAGIEFGLPVESVQEIVRPGAFVKVPLTPPYILGLTNLRGNILPVLDMRMRLGLPAPPPDEHSRLLVLRFEMGGVCLLVDEVREVRSYREEILEPPPETGEDFGGFVRWVAKFDRGERVVFWLDTGALLGEKIEAPHLKTGFQAGGSLPAETSHGATSSEIRVLSFRLGEEEYAFPIERIREIIRYRSLHPIPEAPSYVKGLLTLRQKVVPVFDLRALLGLESVYFEACRKIEHLQKILENQLSFLEENPSEARKELLRRGKDFLLSAWVQERLEHSRHEQEFQLLKKIEHAWECFLKALNEPRGDFRNWAEEILSALEGLKEIMGKSLPEEERILILEKKNRLFGLLVDRVEEVCGIPKKAIEPPPEGEDLKGIARLSGQRLIFILNDETVVPQSDLEDFSEEGEMEGEKMREQVEECQLVTFYLGEEEYGIPITRVQEINRLGRITRVPRTPDFVEGVTNLRGEIIPVIDLRKRFGLQARSADDRTRLVIVQINGKKNRLCGGSSPGSSKDPAEPA